MIVWSDARSGNTDIYAQRVNNSGVVQWAANGVTVCAAANSQVNPQIISDGSGGAIITWSDYRTGVGSGDVYAQRVNSGGTVQWATNGVSVCAAANNQYEPYIVSDGSGGGIITWHDYRNGSNFDIYAQRVNGSSAVQWTANGVTVCAAADHQSYPRIVVDGSGGAIIAWQDSRTGGIPDIYAQRVNSGGTVQWAANGVSVCAAAYAQQYMTMASDNSGGAVMTWVNAGSPYTVSAQRINGSGTVQWGANYGVVVCNGVGTLTKPKIAYDGSGGAVITWMDNRSNPSVYRSYAQRVSGGAALWTANGVVVCDVVNRQEYPSIAGDGSGGGIIAWHDYRNNNWDIYAQHIDGSGAYKWSTSGVTLCAAVGEQSYPQIISDGFGGAIAVWQDYRGGSNYDIYAQKIAAFGKTIYADLYANIEAALNAAATGDVVQLSTKTYTGTDNGYNIDWPAKNNITLRGAGSNVTIISAEALGRIFNIANAISLTIEAMTIKDGNCGAERGGAISCSPSAIINLKNINFINNKTTSSGDYGGGVAGPSGTFIVDSCLFKNNSANSGTGGVGNGGTWKANNSIFIGNSAWTGGIAGNFAGWTVTSCVFYGNSAGFQAHIENNCDFNAKNTIIWGQVDNNLFNNNIGGTVTIKYSDIQGGYAGTGNKNVNPLFINAAGENFHLLLTSECINSGTSEGAPLYDLDGNSRPNPANPPNNYFYYDMGCYEQAGTLSSDLVYVATTGSNTNGAGTIDLPYQTIGFALTKVATTGVVQAAAGIYRERNIIWPVYSNITLRGAGSNETIISGQALGRVISVEAVINLSIESLTIKDGSIESEGAGIRLNTGANLLLRNVNFIKNMAYPGYSGAIHNRGGMITAEFCSFISNEAGSGAISGNIYPNARYVIKNCLFKDNSAYNGGVTLAGYWKVSGSNFINNRAYQSGGLWGQGGVSYNSGVPGTTWEVADCSFIGNNAWVGGVACGGDWSIDRCTFEGNSSSYNGGVSINTDHWTVSNSRFLKNSAVGNGGVVFSSTGVYITDVTNCLFVSNEAVIGGVSCGGNWFVKNSTFYNNKSSDGLSNIKYANWFNADNSIVWQNIAGSAFNNVQGTLEYCDLPNNVGGNFTTRVATINADPLFVNASAGDFHLLATSECVNSGTFEGAPLTDLDGNSRPLPANPGTGNKLYFDMGCYEQIGSMRAHNQTKDIWYPTIQAALNNASAGNLITLEAGIFLEHNITWPAYSNITIRGAGSNETIISGDSLGRVISVEAAVNLTIEALTIKSGKVTDNSGGGIYLPPNAVLYLRSVNIKENSATSSSYLYGYGGAIYCGGAKVIANNSTFSDNVVDPYSGAVSGGDGTGSWEATDCSFINNYAKGNGGCFSLLNLKATRCTFTGNQSDNYGGVFNILTGTSEISSCYFWNNIGGYGGVSRGSRMIANNCIFDNNTAFHGAVSYGDDLTIVNSVLTNNFGNNMVEGGNFNAINSIVWDNGGSMGPVLFDGGATYSFKYSDVQDSVPSGPGNKSVNPLFASDYRLPANSECVNSGTFEGAPLTDLDGNPRPLPANPGTGNKLYFDMGCYEQDGVILPPSVATLEVTINGRRFVDGDILPPNRSNTVSIKALDPSVVNMEMWLDSISVPLVGPVGIPPVWGGTFTVTPDSSPVHILTFYAYSGGLGGTFVTLEAQVLAGSVQVVGVPLNYPNPFKPMSGGTTRIQYTLTDDANVTLILFDITGQEMKRMVFTAGGSGGKAGINMVEWDGRSLFGEVVGNGMYIYKITIGGRTIGTGKLVVRD